MGPSGPGKTTLLNCLSGLDDIDEGRVLVDGRSIHELPDAERTRHRASSMGFVFQAFNLIPVFTVSENVELPLLSPASPSGRRGGGLRRRCTASASGTASSTGRPSSRAASSSGSRSRGRSPAGRGSSGRTSRPATSTRRRRPR